MSAAEPAPAEPPLRRWRDPPPGAPPRPPEAAGPEARAANLFARAALPADPSPARLEEIRRRIQASATGAAALAGPLSPDRGRGGPDTRGAGLRRARWAVAAALLAVSGLSLAGYAVLRPPASRPSAPDDPATRAPASIVAPPVAPAPGLPPRPRRASARRSAARPAAWSDETRRLLAATTKLRRQGDAEAALAEIAALLRHHPRGVLAPEARALQVEALLTAGRPAEALRALDALDLRASPRGSELRLLRAELRARDDCARALPDFTALLGAPSLPPAQLERALRGRAVCHLDTGNPSAARADLQRYLARFPDTPHGPEVRRLLPASPGAH